MKSMQKLGSALMLPVACLPICGILMGLGYALAPAALDAPGSTEGFAYLLGYFLMKAGGALIDHIALLFSVGVAVGMARDNHGTAGLAGLVSWLVLTTTLSPDTVKILAPHIVSTDTALLAFQNVDNAFTGILCGLIGAGCYNRFRDLKLPEVLSFFSGKRSVAIVTTLASLALSGVLVYLWPLVFSALVAVGQGIAGMGVFGAGLYAFLNRLLIPTGLHHALNNVFFFDTIGLGDLTAYWNGETAAEAGWSVGMYMSGFFPCTMFGIPGAALAMIRTAKSGRRKATLGLVGAAALCSFLCGVTEPFEFSFMFLAFPLYIVYSALYGIFTIITVALGFRAGVSFSAGLTDLVFSASLPAAAKTWLILPLGLAAFVVFYLVFAFAIRRWDLKTPGREAAPPEEFTLHASKNSRCSDMAGIILEGLGGKENIASLDHCITRLRLEVKDPGKVDDGKIKSAGIAGVIHPEKNAVQVVIGPRVQFVFEEVQKRLK